MRRSSPGKFDRVIAHPGQPSTVIPVKTGIQKYPTGNRPVLGNTLLDSRENGNDGFYMRLP